MEVVKEKSLTLDELTELFGGATLYSDGEGEVLPTLSQLKAKYRHAPSKDSRLERFNILASKTSTKGFEMEDKTTSLTRHKITMDKIAGVKKERKERLIEFQCRGVKTNRERCDRKSVDITLLIELENELHFYCHQHQNQIPAT